ncbi:MAG: NF038143 family protein [Desulfopila sp.]|jgi:hypothetical protein|nr:NF038143 family protein [Desulfopila sp.]
MTSLSLEEKKILILNNEETMAGQLAVRVLDKPQPPIWMILIPIFFVFFAAKMKQYSKGLKEFSKNYMISRVWALDAAHTAVANDKEIEIEKMLQQAEGIPENAMPLYRDWLNMVAEHYYTLLAAHGTNHSALVRAGYRNKSSYLLFCDRLSKAENALNQALLPDIEGELEDVNLIIEKMAKNSSELRRIEVEKIFS